MMELNPLSTARASAASSSSSSSSLSSDALAVPRDIRSGDFLYDRDMLEYRQSLCCFRRRRVTPAHLDGTRPFGSPDVPSSSSSSPSSPFSCCDRWEVDWTCVRTCGCCGTGRVLCLPKRWPVAFDFSFDFVRDRHFGVASLVYMTYFVLLVFLVSESSSPWIAIIIVLNLYPVFAFVTYANNPFVPRRGAWIAAFALFVCVIATITFAASNDNPTFLFKVNSFIQSYGSLVVLAAFLRLLFRKQKYCDESMSKHYLALRNKLRSSTGRGTRGDTLKDRRLTAMDGVQVDGRGNAVFMCHCGAQLKRIDLVLHHFQTMHKYPPLVFMTYPFARLLSAPLPQSVISSMEEDQAAPPAPAPAPPPSPPLPTHEDAPRDSHIHLLFDADDKPPSGREARVSVAFNPLEVEVDGPDAPASIDSDAVFNIENDQVGEYNACWDRCERTAIRKWRSLPGCGKRGAKRRKRHHVPTPIIVLASTGVCLVGLIVLCAAGMDSLVHGHNRLAEFSRDTRTSKQLVDDYVDIFTDLVYRNVTDLESTSAGLNISAANLRSLALNETLAESARQRLLDDAAALEAAFEPINILKTSILFFRESAVRFMSADTRTFGSVDILVLRMRALRTTIDRIHYVFDSSKSNFLFSAFVAVVAALCFSFYAIYQSAQQYKNMSELVRSGKAKHVLGYKWQPKTFKAEKTPLFLGVQFSTALVGFVVVASLVFLIVFVLSWDVTYAIISRPVVYMALMQIVLAYIVRLVVFDRILGAKLLSDGYFVKRPTLWTWWAAFMYFVGFITGIVSAAIRFAFLFVFAIAALFRLDDTIFPERLVGWDGGFQSFMSLVVFQHRHSNPVWGVLVNLLRRRWRTQVQQAEASGIMDPEEEERESARLSDVSELPSRDRRNARYVIDEDLSDDESVRRLPKVAVSRQRALNRWHAAYHMVRHPLTQLYRRSSVRE